MNTATSTACGKNKYKRVNNYLEFTEQESIPENPGLILVFLFSAFYSS